MNGINGLMSIVASADICVRSACMERNESTILKVNNIKEGRK